MNPSQSATVIGLFKQARSTCSVTKIPPDTLIEEIIASCHGDMRTIGEEIDRTIAEKTK